MTLDYYDSEMSERLVREYRARVDAYTTVIARRTDIRHMVANQWGAVWPDELDDSELVARPEPDPVQAAVDEGAAAESGALPARDEAAGREAPERDRGHAHPGYGLDRRKDAGGTRERDARLNDLLAADAHHERAARELREAERRVDAERLAGARVSPEQFTWPEGVAGRVGLVVRLPPRPARVAGAATGAAVTRPIQPCAGAIDHPAT